MSLIDFLKESEIDKYDIDSKDRILVHQKILKRKIMLREIFTEIHQIFYQLEKIFFNTVKGAIVEIGAGVMPIRDTYPDVIATDIVLSNHLDCVIDAQKMAFNNNSIKLILGQNCFHHFPDPEKFFSESMRVLVAGGGIILIEPYYGPMARFTFKRLFKTEGFDIEFPSWKTPSQGPMKGANQALSYIVFERDLTQFESLFPKLKIIHEKPIDNYVRYLLSGGLNFKQLVPSNIRNFLKLIEKIFAKFDLDHFFALHHIIVLKKDYS